MPLDDIALFSGYEYIFAALLILYLSGALLSLLVCRSQKGSNAVANVAAAAASLTGIIFCVCKLLIYNGRSFDINLKTGIYPISISFHIDNLSAFFVLVISLLAFVASIYSMGYLKHYYNSRNIGVFGFLYNLFIASMIMVVTSGNIFFFLVAWEIMSMVSYFLVVFENEKPETQRAGTIYIIMTHIGTAFIIAAFVLIYQYTGSASFAEINASGIPYAVKNVIFIFSLIGFGTKAGIIPLHIWLPKAHPAAPGNISALMSGVMIKTAAYGIIRIVFDILGGGYLWWGTAILLLGGISAIVGIAFAFMEIDIKKLLAYSSVENMGIIFIGIGLSSIACSNGNTVLAVFSLTASLLHIFNHSVFKGLLFLGAGSVHYSTGTRNMERLGGLIRKMPYTAMFFLAGALSISALPPFNGFVSEWAIYQALFASAGTGGSWMKIIIIVTAALLAIAGVLAAASFIKTFGTAFLALPRTSAAEEAKEAPRTMLAGMGILAALCLAAGIFPVHLLKLLDGINREMLNASIFQGAAGYSSLVLHSYEGNTSISPAALAIIGLLLIPAVLLAVRYMSKNSSFRNYGTWDCGYRRLDSRMQYTATGFSKPVRIVFRAFYRPQRELQIERGSSRYFFKRARYKVSTVSVFEKYLYEPIVRSVVNFARRMRLLIQTGSIHTYLIYIFVVVIAMLIYYARA
ncbi:hydrogenase-4 component B [Anaerobacterium chartisolvens]|uniref:Hydrogenase-4 component B n=1 Tax=Anaerobacterium chartisolvens TaxID=1297424 RepID=A0A369B609_9FIRM|nr:hydrogenase 4 subunit B [Anaerobacterium chartisolvens]RCX16871.1 hydrogenase-4 component B [Anaerobacterium chartisolvens]